MGYVDNSQIAPLYANTTAGTVADASVVDPAIAALIIAINTNYDLFINFSSALFPTPGELPIPDQSVVTRHLRNLAVTNPKLAPLAVTADKIADGSITLTKLADLVVTAAKIANGTITEQKYADSSVSSRVIGNGVVRSQHIDPGLLLPYTSIAVQQGFDHRGIDVTDARWGAKGDGVTDDTAAIQSAINYVYSNGGGKVFFPKGIYLISSQLFMKAKVFLVGVVPGNVLYDAVDKTASTLKYTGNDWAVKFTESPNASQSGIIDLNIIGNTSAKGGIKINDTINNVDPSLDLYISGVCVAYFPNGGYGLHMQNTYRNVIYRLITRQCGCGISTLDTTNDITIADPIFEWCAIAASFYKSVAINITGMLAEGLGVRPDVTLPSDLFVWSDYGRTINYYYGGIRNFGSTVFVSGKYMESVNGNVGNINGDIFMLELGAVQTIENLYIECSANEGYIINKTNGATALKVSGLRIQGSPTNAPALINLDNSPFNCSISPIAWTGTRSVPFIANLGTVGPDGGFIHSPDSPAERLNTYGVNISAKTITDNSSLKLLGSYNRSAIDNYWEIYRQDGDGTDKFMNIRRMNGGSLESYLTFRPADMYFSKPIIQDSGTSLTLGRTAPSSPVAGTMYWDNTAGTIKVFNGTVWKSATLT
ncbi:glycosyl hydrolase family 28-related protein [Paenibacillus sp. P32E]|uniref:glycosyl hydrolase family 28-related protein n=1 Tax=Paenibacillus sp. P32E TaxID=1349434 RepID=UPI000938F68D|nr:glycosyl hydrolase family 28-related protein [Paenibacillus sp. P32E]OKP91421.1 hypothetical protein A3848_09980 [Paenibacillus sp. P32E]